MLNTALSADITGTMLIFIGLVTIAGELLSPSHGALALGGMLGLFVGATILNEPSLAATVNGSGSLLISMTVVAFGLALVAAWMATAVRRRRVVTGKEAMIGAIGSVLSWGGDNGHIFLHGERWRATGGPMVSNGSVRVIGINGLTLEVEPAIALRRDQEPRQS